MEAQSSERGPGKELEMGFIRDHTTEQASSELGRAGRGGQLGNGVCEGTERADQSVSGHRGPHLEQGRASPGSVGGHRAVGPEGKGTGALSIGRLMARR